SKDDQNQVGIPVKWGVSSGRKGTHTCQSGQGCTEGSEPTSSSPLRMYGDTLADIKSLHPKTGITPPGEAHDPWSRRLCISVDTSTPHIIVVGDVGSGKSSVLEAITHKSFPRGQGLVTRFATEVRLRRAPKRGTIIRISPDEDRPLAEKKRLAGLSYTVNAPMKLSDIIARAEQIICPGPKHTHPGDILRIEVSGPEIPHMTVVDLPGFTQPKASVLDSAAVVALANSYMRNPRTTVLAVVRADSENLSQDVIEGITKVDPRGTRTLGIITMPDLAVSPEDTIALARNQKFPLRLGWHILRNRSPGEMDDSSDERNLKEREFFRADVWAPAGQENLGVDALWAKLNRQIVRHSAYQTRYSPKGGPQSKGRAVTRIGSPVAPTKIPDDYVEGPQTLTRTMCPQDAKLEPSDPVPVEQLKVVEHDLHFLPSKDSEPASLYTEAREVTNVGDRTVESGELHDQPVPLLLKKVETCLGEAAGVHSTTKGPLGMLPGNGEFEGNAGSYPDFNRTEKSLIDWPAIRKLRSSFRLSGQLPPTGEHQTNHLGYQEILRPLLVSILSTTLQFLGMKETALIRGEERVRWNCVCGHRSYFDVRELRPGAAKELEYVINERFTHTRPLTHGETPRGSVQDIILSLYSFVAQKFMLSARRTSELPIHESQPPRIAMRETASPLPTAEAPRYLLLCVKDGKARFAPRLVQRDIRALKTDREFFEELKSTYPSVRRRWKSLHAPKNIKFIRFDLYAGDIVSIANGACELPPESKLAPPPEYTYLPGARAPATVPPIDSSVLMHFFANPACADDALGPILELFPKKLREPLLRCPKRGSSTGWGVVFEEGWRWSGVCGCGLGALVVFGIVFAVA
ncbi:MAG: hypothetical protein M1839_007910, partial [Geoglossum umbratile]